MIPQFFCRCRYMRARRERCCLQFFSSPSLPAAPGCACIDMNFKSSLGSDIQRRAEMQIKFTRQLFPLPRLWVESVMNCNGMKNICDADFSVALVSSGMSMTSRDELKSHFSQVNEGNFFKYNFLATFINSQLVTMTSYENYDSVTGTFVELLHDH